MLTYTSKAGFPTVVSNASVTANNTGGGIHFDSTPAVFDPLVIGEYLDGTGNQGGPLVTSFNVSSRSDLRLYESDNNATMINLRAQGLGFLSTCSALLSRMIETVPSDVVLSDIIKPMTLKPVNATLDFDGDDLIFTGVIRVSLLAHLSQLGRLAKIVTFRYCPLFTAVSQQLRLPLVTRNL